MDGGAETTPRAPSPFTLLPMRPQRFLRSDRWRPLRRALVWLAVVVVLWAAIFGFVYLGLFILDEG
jgi:hypothetical protein